MADAVNSAPMPTPATTSVKARPICSPTMVGVVRRTPKASPWLMLSTAPEPGDKAIIHAAAQ